MGYKKGKDTIHGTIDTPTRQATYIKQALEGFAERRYLNKIDAVRFLQENGVISNKHSANKGIITFTNMLRNPFYAGYIEYPKWEVERRIGHHKGIISIDTFDKNQKILNGKDTVFVRKDIREDFILRGLVNCAKCGTKLTGADSRSKTGRLYPYYKCPNKQCSAYGKSIRAEDIHKGFIEIMKGVRASQELENLAISIFKDVWEGEMREKDKEIEKNQVYKKQLEETIKQITVRVTNTENDIVLKQYEKQIEMYAKQLEEIETKLKCKFDYTIPYRTSMEEVLGVLSNPYTVWENYDAFQKQKFFYFILMRI